MLIMFAILAVLQPLAMGAIAYKRVASHPNLARFKFTLTAIVILLFYMLWYYVFQSVWVKDGAA